MAAAKNRAAATSVTAKLLKPPNANFKAPLVPSSSSGVSIEGANPSSTAVNEIIIA